MYTVIGIILLIFLTIKNHNKIFFPLKILKKLTLKMKYSLSQVKHLKLLQIKKLKTKSLKDSKSKI
jgi:hypothetical protein